jgi:nucleoside-diphosphate-sugar epimerase
MKIFVTGATGHIGSLVTAELIDAGHQVVGLSRTESGAQRLAALGAEPIVGTMDDTARVAELAAGSDGVVNLAFQHDRGDFGAALVADRALIEAIGGALAGTGKPFLAASGTLMLVGSTAPGEIGTEDTVIDTAAAANPRAITEGVLLGLADRGVRSAALRFAPTVHGPSDLHGFMPSLIAAARKQGGFGYIGDGANRWPAVHNLDTAHLIRLALERDDLPAGIPLHVAAEAGVPFRRIAEAIGRGAGVPVENVTEEFASEHYGFVGAFIGLDNPTSSAKTRELLAWTPTHPTLLEDLEEGFYFNR